MKFSLTLMTLCSMLFLTSCVSSTGTHKEKALLDLDLQTSNKNKEIIRAPNGTNINECEKCL